MPLRTARAQDFQAVSTVFATAFQDEEMIGGFMHPHRHNYPQDYHRYWEHKVTEWYWDYSHQLVTTYTLSPGGEEIITGVGDWIRHGKGWERYWRVWARWDPRNIILQLILLHHRMTTYFHPNRAADPAAHKLVATAVSCIKHVWSGTRATGWYLNYLGVDPAHQNQGYGRALAKWGVEKAREEGVSASVISGTDKDRFYRRCGFEEMVGRVTDGEGNPLRGVTEAGAILFCDPKGR